MAKVYVVIRDVGFDFSENEDSILEAGAGAVIENIFADEDQAVRYIRDIVQKWTEYYERKFEKAEAPFQKYQYERHLDDLKYAYDEISEGRYVIITDGMYYHYESHEVK